MGLYKRLLVRLSVVRKMKANLILVTVGLFLILLAPCWHFVIAPSLKVVPTDFDLFYKYSGTLTKFANPPGEPVIGQTPVEIPIIMERFILSKPHLSRSGTSAVSVETNILESTSGNTLYESEELVSMDRKTGELTKVDSNNGANGYLIVFPFDTPEKNVPIWFGPAGKALEASFSEKTSKSGLTVFGFKLELSGIPVETPAGYPGKYTGTELKETFSMPELGVNDDEIYQADYKANASIYFLTEPVMGNIVDVTNGELDILLNIEKPESGFKVSKLILKMNFSKNPESVGKATVFARDELSKRTLQYTYIPIGLLILGLIVSTIGLFAGTAVISNNEDD
ncbi:MAG: DUF3068 domain-containing protein [Actinobacteria bacterium]|nr:DUF3068 domain-containing protein [Actinomycetota bacterium]